MKPDRLDNSINTAFLTAIVTMLSVGQFSIFFDYHSGNFSDLMNATINFFQGETHWRAFQNRITGPAIVSLIDNAYCYPNQSCNYEKALKTYYLLITITSNLVFLFLILRLGEGFLASFGWTLSFICGQMLCWSPYYFPWDNLELLLFSIMLFSDLRRQRTYVFFYVVFFAWVATKETAMFVPIWLVLTRFALPAKQFDVKSALWNNRVLLANAAAMFGITVVVVKALRDILFVRSMISPVGSDSGNEFFGNFVTPVENYNIIRRHLAGLTRVYLEPQTYSSLYAVMFLLILVYILYRIYRRRDLSSVNLRITLFPAIYLAAVFISARIDEPRVYLPLIPMFFLIFLKIGRAERSPVALAHPALGMHASSSRAGSAPRAEKPAEWEVGGVP